MATIRMLLRDAVTGEEAWHEEQLSDGDDARDNAEFYWTDGNGGCDCERARILQAAHGKSDPDRPCGNERIVIVEATIDGHPFPKIVDRLPPVSA